MGPVSSTVSPDLLDGTVAGVGLDVIYDMLKNRRRRMVFYYLAHTLDGEASVGDLAEQLAAWENDIPLNAVDSTARKRTYNTLQQHHLPKLDEAGLVDYDRARGQVTLLADSRQIDLFLNWLPKAEFSRITLLLVAGTVFWLAVLATWFGVHVLGVPLPSFVLPSLGLGFFALFVAHGVLTYRLLHSGDVRF